MNPRRRRHARQRRKYRDSVAKIRWIMRNGSTITFSGGSEVYWSSITTTWYFLDVVGGHRILDS